MESYRWVRRKDLEKKEKKKVEKKVWKECYLCVVDCEHGGPEVRYPYASHKAADCGKNIYRMKEKEKQEKKRKEKKRRSKRRDWGGVEKIEREV